VGAAVVLKGDEDVSAEDLQAFVKQEVAAYKYPRQIWFADELPKTATGKVVKREIEIPERARSA
jgi:long-chain acyl-CoA synthetase